MGCSSLTHLELPDSATTIEEEAFKDCTGLQSLKISPNATKIGSDAFKNCVSLQHITLCSSVKLKEVFGELPSSCKLETMDSELEKRFRRASPCCSAAKTRHRSARRPSMQGISGLKALISALKSPPSVVLKPWRMTWSNKSSWMTRATCGAKMSGAATGLESHEHEDLA